MNLTEKNIREKNFHNELQSKDKGRFENIFYKAIYNIDEDFFDFLKKNVKDSEVLDYGCGVGNSVEKVIKYNPKKITGIDISEISINKAKNKADGLGLDVNYKVDNCEKTSFDTNSFDIIYGSGILHHLQIDKCLEEIHRILKPNGRFVLVANLHLNYKTHLKKLFPSVATVAVNRKFEVIECKS